jgi:hypothetical protein
MSLFSSIPIRTNAKTDVVDASWWNTIRSKLIEYFGEGVTGETIFTIADNQASYQNITGLSFDGDDYSHVKIEYTIYRTNGGGTERKESGTLILNYKKTAQTWTINRRSEDDDALNVASSLALNVSSGVAQVQYKSDSVGGTYQGVMTYKVSQTFNTEA